MNKAVLVMDNFPDSCQKCRLCHLKMDASGMCICNYTKEQFPWEIAKKERHEKCPLVPMPEKMLKTGECWVNGWNAAIDAIGGKDSDGERSNKWIEDFI